MSAEDDRTYAFRGHVLKLLRSAAGVMARDVDDGGVYIDDDDGSIMVEREDGSIYGIEVVEHRGPTRRA